MKMCEKTALPKNAGMEVDKEIDKETDKEMDKEIDRRFK